jgi:hypothetical protein
VKTREQRDEETIVIVRTLVWLTAVVILGMVLLPITRALTTVLGGPVLDSAVWVVVGGLYACVAIAPLAYLYRHRRP